MGIREAQKHTSINRFLEILRNLHVVNNADLSPGDGYVKPVLDVLSQTFYRYYIYSPAPCQEVSVEAMVKYKGRVGGKVHMPKKPIRVGFKIWCLCCSYLCTFQMYEGRPTDPVTKKKVSEKRYRTNGLLSTGYY